MNRRSMLISSSAFGVSSCATGAAGRSTAAMERIDAAAQQIMRSPLPPPGLALAIYTPDGIHVRPFGVANVEERAAVTEDTAFYLASSAKSFTALAMSELEIRGELDLDATLAAFAPEAGFPEAVRPGEVTLRRLLTHTHGIRNDALAFRLAATGQHDAETRWSLLGSSSANETAPLGQFQYTNVGYNILTTLTDRMLSTPWQDLIETRVLTPAGMTRSAARISSAAGWSIAQAHYSAAPGGPVRLALQKRDETMHSAGGVIMSARDAAKWLDLMINDGVVRGRRAIAGEGVSRTRAQLAEVGQTFGAYSRDHYGLGWYIGRYRDETLVHHFGGSVGARVHFSYMPRRRTGVAVLVNDSAPIAEAADALANFAYDHLAGRSDAQNTFDAALAAAVEAQRAQFASIAEDRTARSGRQWTLTRPRSAYVGSYDNPRWGSIEVRERGDALELVYGVLSAAAEPFTAPDTMRIELQPFSGDVVQFAFRDGDVPLGLAFNGQRYMRRR